MVDKHTLRTIDGDVDSDRTGQSLAGMDSTSMLMNPDAVGFFTAALYLR